MLFFPLEMWNAKIMFYVNCWNDAPQVWNSVTGRFFTHSIISGTFDTRLQCSAKSGNFFLTLRKNVVKEVKESDVGIT